MASTILFGGSGFLGPILLQEYPDIISIGRTTPPPEVTNKHIHLASMDDLHILDDLEFDKVIFLIGNSNHHQINAKPAMGIEYNVLPLKKILYYLRNSKHNIKKFIAFTTILLYDVTKIQFPVSETQVINPYINDYVFSKYLAEEITKLYKDIPIINVRFSNIYGPTRLIRPDLVPTLVQKALTEDKLEVWTIEPQRDFIFAQDAAEAVVKLLDTDYTGPVNLGTGSMHSVGEIAQIVGKLAGKRVTSLNKKVSGPMKFVVDTSLLKRLIDWEPKHTLEQGLTKTYEVTKQLLNVEDHTTTSN